MGRVVGRCRWEREAGGTGDAFLGILCLFSAMRNLLQDRRRRHGRVSKAETTAGGDKRKEQTERDNMEVM